MKSRNHLILLAAACAWCLAAISLLAAGPTQAALPAGRSSLGDGSVRAAEDITVRTVSISNEPPGYLIDHLYTQLGENSNFFEALGYLKDHSNGVISEEFYHAVDTALFSEEVKLSLLRDYRRPFTGTVEIGEDGTFRTNALRGNAAHPGFTAVLSPDGQFILNYAQDPADYILTHEITSIGDFTWHYYAFAIAWRGDHVYLPLIVR